MKIKLLFLIFLMSANFLLSQSKVLWQKQTISTNLRVKSSKQDLPRTQTFSLNIENLKEALLNVSRNSKSTSLVLSFPNSDGIFERFRIYETSVMDSELAARYPEIKSYAGQGIDDPSSIIRFSVTPLGFQSMRLSANKPASFIEAITDDASVYSVFTRASRINFNNDFECSVSESLNTAMNSQNIAFRNADDGILRTYRLVVSATGEYTNYHGGTKADALAAIVQTMVRVNGIFEVDFNVNMTLIANTDDVIFTNPGTDPYTTTGSYNGQLQSELTSTIGESNYDIGHLFANLQNNGNAGCIGCVCVNNQKGRGWTSAAVPEGDFFDVDYVAHEMGHQFGANHTWTHNGSEGTGVQAEPGSGTTIMSYAGITGASTDVEQNVTPNFHAVSIEQVTDYVKSTSCQTETITGNAVPVVTLAATNYTIPRGTPFELDGSATDASNPANTLSYCWEQIDDNSGFSTFPSPTKTGGVAFRAYEPTSETNRYFPRLETIKTGATSWQWEAVPNVSRTLNFRLTVRDNVVGGGTNSSGDVAVNVNGAAGPFVVNSPNTNVTWDAGTTQMVTWNVAGTTGNGVNAANVDIFLSTDGGDTYLIPLATGVPNDGSQDIVVPNNQGTQNRVMVRGENHIFFDISDTNFTIAAPIPCTASVPSNFASSNVGPTQATLSWDLISAVVFDIQYREVGSVTWIDASTSNTNLVLTGLTPETDYEAQIRSRCANNTTSAYSAIINFSTTAVPPCTGTQIVSYPYLETFDSGIGDWIQASGDDGDWILDANGTPTGNTGPSDDITGGGNYLFLEASSNGSPGEIGANAAAILEGPCFDLTSLTGAYLTFNYHLFGTNTGSLEVEISNDNGSSWINIFNIAGNQGNAWNEVTLDLSAFVNQIVKTRFIGTTGNGFTSDMAIDHIGMIESIPLIYCDSNGNNTNDEFIDRVQLNTLDNNNSGIGTDGTGYSDFTNNLGLVTNLFAGAQYTITITPEWTGTIYDEGYAVWIDYNKNGDFSDPGELVFTQAPTQATSVSGTFTLPIPTEAVYGQTRMRVSLKYNQIPTECESFAFGEVEDYTVNIVFDGLLFSNNTWTPSAPNTTTTADNVLILDGTYNTTTDISINDLVVNSGATISVNEANNITVGGNIDVLNNGDLALNSSSTVFSSLLVDGTVTGNVKYNRHVTSNAGGNDLIAPPVSGEAFTSFIANNSNVFSNTDQTLYLFGPFEKPLNQYALFANNESTTLDAAKGYRTASTDDSTFTFEGAVTTGSLSVPIEKTGLDYDKWNLIGNPYTSYIRLEDFLMANLNELDPNTVAVYGYDADITFGTEWTIWNMAYSDNNPGSLIAPGQGFFVSSKDGGSNVIFNPSMRTIGTSDDFIAGRNSNLAHFVITMSRPNKTYNTDIYFNNTGTLGLDIGYDAALFEEEPSSFSIYSELSEGGQDLNMAIQTIGFNDVNGTTVIPIGINLLQGQQVTISMDTSDLEYNVYFEDTLTNTITLLNSSDYNLTAETNLLGTGRFYLRFETETLSVIDSELDLVQIYNNSVAKQIVVKGQLTEDTSFVLYDVQGREIIRTDLDADNNVNVIDVSNYAKGVYLVQLSNTKYTISKKLIIR